MTEPTAFGSLRAPRHLLGAGQREALPDHVARLGRRALLVTDARMEADAAFRSLRAAIEAHGVEVAAFAAVEPELPLDCLRAGVAAGAGAEVVVGIGGGSCLDAAKVVALLLAHGGEPADCYGEYRVPGPVLPVVAVPTTAGTGSEVTSVAVLADPGRAMRIGIASPRLVPEVAICDPDLTATCPPGLTAASGADALTHAIEAFTTLRRPASGRLTLDHVFVGKNALSDALALEAIRLIGRSPGRAVADGADREARADTMLGSTRAGLAFGAAGTAAAHAIQYPVGAMTHTPHGLGVATLMPYVMAFDRPSCEAEMAEVGAALGLSAEGPAPARAEAAVEAVAALFARVGVPRTLAGLGLAADRLVKHNPRPLDAGGMARLVRAAFDGDRAALAGPPADPLPVPSSEAAPA